MAKLFVVGTPIGNLGDITFRAVETLKNVDFIAAEDTRHTLQLLNHFEIKKPLVSCRAQNEKFAADKKAYHFLCHEEQKKDGKLIAKNKGNAVDEIKFAKIQNHKLTTFEIDLSELIFESREEVKI